MQLRLVATLCCLPAFTFGLRSDVLLRSDAQLAAKLEQVAQYLPEGATKDLMTSLRICGQCNHYARFGEDRDGGYLTCLDGIQPGSAQQTQLRAAYSIGVANHDKWASDVAQQLHLHVYQLDCTVSQAPAGCSNCSFIQKCARSADGHGDSFPGQSMTMQEILAQTGNADAPPRSLLLKMDIEGSEWPILEVENQDLLSKFNQVIMEFHWLKKQYNHEQYARGMQRLLQSGFRVTHIHGNNHAGMFSVGGYSIPDCMEVTLTSMGQARSTCLKNQEYIKGLDRPCAPSGELPMAHVP